MTTSLEMFDIGDGVLRPCQVTRDAGGTAVAWVCVEDPPTTDTTGWPRGA